MNPFTAFAIDQDGNGEVLGPMRRAAHRDHAHDRVPRIARCANAEAARFRRGGCG